MIILRITERTINRYIRKVKKGKLKKPSRCPICGALNKLSWHGEYSRKLITLSGIFHIPIKRLKCHQCTHVFALLPDFVKKFHRYAADVIAFAVKNLKKQSCDDVADTLMNKYYLYVSNITLYCWKKKFPVK